MEYPMVTAGLELQVVVLAVNVKGDCTWAPFEGVTTVMADAGTEAASTDTIAKMNVFIALP
jgi:hypothetical protein